MSLASTLREAADQNQKLLVELAATDYAPSSLAQNTSYISDLKGQIGNTDKELARLHTITEDERKDHVKYRDSNVKRWAYKLQGSKGKDKFSSKQEKEEREFLEAWQKERSAQETREELARALEQAQKERTHLENDAKRQQEAQTQLDQLYSSIFSGPTPDVPGEDGLEQNVQNARAHLEHTQGLLSNDSVALSALNKAEQNLKSATSHIGDALRRSQRDMWGGGTFTDMMERDALAQAQGRVTSTTHYMGEARRYQPAISALSEITVDEGHFFSDVMFDNIFTDMLQHDRIGNTERQIVQARKQLEGQLAQQKNRVQKGETDVKQAKESLESVRRELQRVRTEAFEKFAQGGAGGDAPPPAY